MSKKTVDVIILSWDRTEDTELAIYSALGQSNVDVNVYVVDQGSKKECIQRIQLIANQHDNVFLKLNNTNTGVPGGRNQASSMGSGEYIVSLDNDAEFVTEYELAKVVEQFNKDKDVAILGFNIKRFGTDNIDETSWSYGLSSSEWAKKDFYTTRFVGAGHAIRRNVFEQVGGYDDSLFFLHEEMDLARRFINVGHKIKYVNHIQVAHKVSAEHRVAWNSGRWAFHSRNKTYLSLKFFTPLHIFIFHTILLWLEGFKKGYLSKTVKSSFEGISMYKLHKPHFKESECRFSVSSESYFRAYTPGAEGSVIKRVIRRIKETLS